MTPRIVTVPFLLAWPQERYAAQVILPNVIFVRRGVQVTVADIAHELAHVDQINRFGWAWYRLRYLWHLLRGGYGLQHPMEAEAERASIDPAYLARARVVIDHWQAQRRSTS